MTTTTPFHWMGPEEAAPYRHLFEGNYWWSAPGTDVGEIFRTSRSASQLTEMNQGVWTLSQFPGAQARDLQEVARLGAGTEFAAGDFPAYSLVRSVHECIVRRPIEVVANPAPPPESDMMKFDEISFLSLSKVGTDGRVSEYMSWAQWRIIMRGRKKRHQAHPILKEQDTSVETIEMAEAAIMETSRKQRQHPYNSLDSRYLSATSWVIGAARAEVLDDIAGEAMGKISSTTVYRLKRPAVGNQREKKRREVPVLRPSFNF